MSVSSLSQSRRTFRGVPDAAKRHLSPPRQRLVALMQQLYFGTIYNLVVAAREPVLNPPPRVIRRRKNGGCNQSHHQEPNTDFALKREWVEFFNDLDQIANGTLLLVEVAHGVPIFHEYEDVINV